MLENLDHKETEAAALFASEPLFDRLAWWYTLCREHLLQDDTESIAQILVSSGLQINGARLLELGCGPGHYALRIAQRFRLLNVIGVDSSARLVNYAKARSRLLKLSNCHFRFGDVRAIPWPRESAEAVIASRLFMILEDRQAVMREVYRVLAPGGFFFIAEPLFQGRAMVPLLIMRALASLLQGGSTSGLESSERLQVRVMGPQEFGELLQLNPWKRIVTWQTKYYQYSLCTKPAAETESGPEVSGARGISAG